MQRVQTSEPRTLHVRGTYGISRFRVQVLRLLINSAALTIRRILRPGQRPPAGARFVICLEYFQLQRLLKNKAWLLSFDCPLRFIFSHSALKEGWDTSNVFQVCTLIEQRPAFTCRQKVGRSLRLRVNIIHNIDTVELPFALTLGQDQDAKLFF